MVTKLIYEISQYGYEVKFNSDLDGMLTVTYGKEKSPEKQHESYIRHEHISYPKGSMEELDKSLQKSLTEFLNEVKTGKEPRKDF